MPPGETFQISLTEDARPFCATTPGTIPFAYRVKLQIEIDLLVKQEIIAPVTEPMEWCSPIVVMPKKNSDKIRMCVDLSKLNKYVRRERYPSVTPAEAVADTKKAKANFFSVFDALKGYHQSTSAHLTSRARNSPLLLGPLAVTSSYGHRMEYHPSANTTIVAWTKHLQACKTYEKLLTTSLRLMATNRNTLTTCDSYCYAARKKESP